MKQVSTLIKRQKSNIVVVENVLDDGVELKPAIIEVFIDVKPIIEASVDVKPSIEAKPIDVSKLRDNEMCGYFEKKTNEWWLAILNGVRNHELEPRSDCHLLAGRLREEGKKRVVDVTKSLALPRNILTNLKEKNKESMTNIKCVCNARSRWQSL
ncbi:hypothetical protein MTR_4g066090 [Medicago truncatula]|uniref:Uncharacterized protein n=1 Tax=Medicago truncatula TaxID=3880 RepID=A0A072ULK2_MEDTR|nr:hypothetical protein MTR_4g066090 [Medicago truncatula]